MILIVDIYFRDSLLFAACNSGTSLFAGFLIFSVLGFMAHETGLDIREVAESGNKTISYTTYSISSKIVLYHMQVLCFCGHMDYYKSLDLSSTILLGLSRDNETGQTY